MKRGRPSGRRVRLIAMWVGLVFSLGLCLALGTGTEHAAPEKTPRDKVVHPIIRGVSPAEVLPETKVDPAYPEKWRELRLGAQVILQVVIDKLGNVTRVVLLRTKLRVERDCGKDSGDQVAPPEAARDFEAAAISAVKQWKFRPATQSGVPVEVFQTLIIDFTLCPKSTGAEPPPIR